MSITIIAIMIIVVIVIRCETYVQEYVQRYGQDEDPGVLRVLRDLYLPGQDAGQNANQDDAGQHATRNRRRHRN